MANRHAIAIQAGETSDLIELAEMLSAACTEVMSEDKPPCMDPAVRLISFQIAFAGNGDIQLYQYYADVYNYCAAMAVQDQQGVPIPKEKKPNVPVYKAS